MRLNYRLVLLSATIVYALVIISTAIIHIAPFSKSFHVSEDHAVRTNKATAIVPLQRFSGTYHAVVYIGSPPQKQQLIVDTGSHLTAFPCEPCMSCGRHASDLYNPGMSDTTSTVTCEKCQWKDLSVCGNENRCELTQRYTEGSSWTAYELEDLVWVGNEDVDLSIEDHQRMAVSFVFGCQITESGLFRNQYADGIMGFAMHPGSIITALLNEGSLRSNSFSLCLGLGSGTLSLGGTTSGNQNNNLVQFTDLVRNHGWYTVMVESLLVGNEEVKRGLYSFNEDKGTIIDSGTTDVYFPKSIANSFQKAWERASRIQYSNSKLSLQYTDFVRIPTITVVLKGGGRWDIDPRFYFEPVEKDSELTYDSYGPLEKWDGYREFTNRIYLDEPKGAVLGTIAMMGHEILFDIKRQKVGVAKSNCEKYSPNGII